MQGGAGPKAVLVQVSCGENFAVAIDKEGYLYTTGLSEFGQLGNGQTGEYFVTASKLAFANETKLTRRSVFVRRDATKADSVSANVSATAPLPDANDIRIGSVACGKNHTVAIEAARGAVGAGGAGGKAAAGDAAATAAATAAAAAAAAPGKRVFTWGSGAYGCLGHREQKDVHEPRLVQTLSGPLFSCNRPVKASAGSTCSLVVTQQGHVYYWGKHRSVGEAQMYPLLLDFLSNNHHVVSSAACGNTTVVCATVDASTVSYGMGPYGELGYGREGGKSSAAPKFVETLDGVVVKDVACGYGHTLLVLKEEDKKDQDNIKKMPAYEAVDDKADEGKEGEEDGGEEGGTGTRRRRARSRGGGEILKVVLLARQ